jgi:hypothetical protein
MQTTHEQIRQRLSLLPETMLQDVLLFIDFLLSRLKIKIATAPPIPESATNFAIALGQFREQVQAEGSDLEEIDFFADVRDRTPAPAEAKW